MTQREPSRPVVNLALPTSVDELAVVAMMDAAAARPVCAPRGIIGSRTVRELGPVDLQIVSPASDLVLRFRQTEGERHMHAFIIPAALAFQLNRYRRLLQGVTPSYVHQDGQEVPEDVVCIAHGDLDAAEADEMPDAPDMLSLLWLTGTEAVRFTVRRTALAGWLLDLDAVVKCVPLHERSAGIVDLGLGETRDVPMVPFERPKPHSVAL